MLKEINEHQNWSFLIPLILYLLDICFLVVKFKVHFGSFGRPVAHREMEASVNTFYVLPSCNSKLIQINIVACSKKSGKYPIKPNKKQIKKNLRSGLYIGT